MKSSRRTAVPLRTATSRTRGTTSANTRAGTLPLQSNDSPGRLRVSQKARSRERGLLRVRRCVLVIPDRILDKITYFDGCWEWTGSLDQNGYGMVRWQGPTRRAHRVIYELVRGPIPDGMEIDHLCRNRCCVNPDHLEVVDHRTNTLRGETIVAKWAVRTHCHKCGSLLEPKSRVRRFCRVCKNRQQRESNWAKRRARGAQQRKDQSGM